MISISFQNEQAILQLHSVEVITHTSNNSGEIYQKEAWLLKRVAKDFSVNLQSPAGV